MNNPTIKFKCPNCKYDILTRIRHEISARDHLKGFFVQTEKSSRKFSVDVEFTGSSEGKAKKFECGRCGFVLMTQVFPGKPITTLIGVYQWLKRHNMIEETE